jgi:hypothetical protein
MDDELEDSGPVLTELELATQNAPEFGQPPQYPGEPEENFIGRVRIAMTGELINHAMRVRMPDWKGEDRMGGTGVPSVDGQEGVTEELS